MKKFAVIAVIAFLIVMMPMLIIAQTLIQPATVLNDTVALTGDVAFDENGFVYNDVTVLLANYFEYGYANDSWMGYFDDKVSDETKQLKNYYMIPCLLAGVTEPDQSLIDRMEEAMIEVIIEEMEDEETGEIIEIEKVVVLDAFKYAQKLKAISPFSSLPITNNTLGGYINMFASINSGINYDEGYEQNMPGLSDEYLESIKDGWGYPFSEYHRVSAGVGLYNPFGEWEQHYGTDFGAPGGTAIYAVKSGTVIAVSNRDCQSTGCFVRTLTEEGLTVEYWHMQVSPTFKIGDYINIGDYIGPVGKTGYATGNHLHLEIRVQSSGSVVDYCQLTSCTSPNIGSVSGSDD